MKYSCKEGWKFLHPLKILQIFTGKHSLNCKMNRVKASQIMKKWGVQLSGFFFFEECFRELHVWIVSFPRHFL